MRTLALAALATFVLDQATKWLVVIWLNLIERGEIDVLPPFLNFRMAWNRGINFGLLSGDTDVMRWVLIAVAVVISAWVVVWVRREGAAGWMAISAGLLVGGAFGNVVDRVIYGAVADFLNMSCCGIENPFAFNVADVAIFMGAFGLVVFTGKPGKGGTTPPKRRKTP
jgi:signal peptidase II